MIVLVVFFALISLVLLVLLFRFRQQIVQINNQIKMKRTQRSSVRVTTSAINQPLQQTVAEINELFECIRVNEVLYQKERQALDAATHNITHDIRTPLTIASGFTQQLLKETAGEEILLEKIKDQLELVSKRLEVLLAYQNLLEHNVHPDFMVLDLSQKLKEELLKFYEALTQQQFFVNAEIKDQLTISCDESILVRIFQNIFSNVLKHGKEEVQVILTEENGFAKVVVKNIAQKSIKNLSKLTSRFYSENMSDTEESSGLGLYIAQELVRLTQGTLVIEEVAQWFSVTIMWSLTAGSQ